MKYTCKDCGKPVARSSDGEIIRTCDCNAPVIAHLSAVARGASAVAGGK